MMYQTWERLHIKYVEVYEELERLMDPSRNMNRYRNLLIEFGTFTDVKMLTAMQGGAEATSGAVLPTGDEGPVVHVRGQRLQRGRTGQL